ncbi:hypothetical protein [Nitrosospira sp. Nl5]|uniref:hypothetical protein n=1 Tax=Nitrosospira sp. Nl5 TaxID=200120 RepID=UPI00115F9D2A|nr:hypothetical protein [Nitrosospira sp. Nl5]
MKFTSMARIARDKCFGVGWRQNYWDARTLASEIARLFTPDNRVFKQLAIRDYWRYLTRTTCPKQGETALRAHAAVQWLLRAQQAAQDDGVPLGYFPCRGEPNGWTASYPETTGYIITSLLAYAECFADSAARDAALSMARWEITIQMPSGAVQGGPVSEPARQTAAAFNTGMVLDGWCSAFRATGAAEFLEAGRRAADFLVADLDENGYFRTNGAYVSAGEIKTYTCLCAWAMYRFGEIAGESRCLDAAIKVIEAASSQQRSNGWFAHNCLTQSAAPLTHTIGYTLQGVLEVGAASQRPDFMTAARMGADPLIERVDRHGLLAGRFYSDWEPAALSSCLTGNAQIAIVCYRLFELTGTAKYKQAADALVDALKVLQILESPNPALNGAIAGSFPLFGGYMRAGYPNWATKYFIDALLLQHRLTRRT